MTDSMDMAAITGNSFQIISETEFPIVLAALNLEFDLLPGSQAVAPLFRGIHRLHQACGETSGRVSVRSVRSCVQRA
jgi:hypothetical protein